jgi:hypothetical protein
MHVSFIFNNFQKTAIFYWSLVFFKVILSSGTRISVQRSGRSLDVRINAPATDKGQVSGLCGNFNDDPMDDLSQGGDGRAYEDEDKFANSWMYVNQTLFQLSN